MVLLVWDYILRTARVVSCSRVSIKPQALGFKLCTGGVNLPMSKKIRRVTGSIKAVHTTGLLQGKMSHSFWANLLLLARLQENQKGRTGIIVRLRQACLPCASLPCFSAVLLFSSRPSSRLSPSPGPQPLHPHYHTGASYPSFSGECREVGIFLLCRWKTGTQSS